MDQLKSLEDALASVERQAGRAIASVTQALRGLKNVQRAAKNGDLATLKRLLADLRTLLTAIQADMAASMETWPYSDEDERRFLGDGNFAREVMDTAERQRVAISDQDGMLMCFPVVIRIDPARRAVRIDRKLFRQLRPSVLVAHLSSLQREPPKTRPAQFLEALFQAWEYARYRDFVGQLLAADVRVDALYAVLTVAPGMAAEYSRQEFGRDLYLLERSTVRETRSGARVHFSRSTGAKERSRTIVVAAEDGRPIAYSSIGFTLP